MTIVEPGWTKFEAPSSKDKILPNLSIGDKVNTLFKLKPLPLNLLFIAIGISILTVVIAEVKKKIEKKK